MGLNFQIRVERFIENFYSAEYTESSSIVADEYGMHGIYCIILYEMFL